jgi:sec-independent protein translocase protein TatA
MDFFGIGFGEVLLVLILILIIWGPKRLPQMARTLGKTIRTLKKASFDFTTQVTKELDSEETESKTTNQLSKPRQVSNHEIKNS